MTAKKTKKVNNFASEGRVMGTGDIKAPPAKKQQLGDDDEDYKPPAHAKDNGDDESVPPTNCLKSKEEQPEATVAIAVKGPRKPKKGAELQRELLALHKDAKDRKAKVIEGDVYGPAGREIQSETGQEKDGTGGSVSGQAEERELRGCRSKDAFVNTHGKGRTLG